MFNKKNVFVSSTVSVEFVYRGTWRKVVRYLLRFLDRFKRNYFIPNTFYTIIGDKTLLFRYFYHRESSNLSIIS